MFAFGNIQWTVSVVSVVMTDANPAASPGVETMSSGIRADPVGNDVPRPGLAEPILSPERPLAAETVTGALDDVRLVERIALGDEAALGAFYERHLGRVFSLARRITRNLQLAEEIAGDAFLQVWREAKRFDVGRGRPIAWLLTITRSRALDALRRADPAILFEDMDQAADRAATHDGLRADATGRSAGLTDDPLDILGCIERDQTLRRAFERLAPVQRQLLALAFFKGLSHSEIATHLGMPLGTVKSHLRHGVQWLKESLGPEFNG